MTTVRQGRNPEDPLNNLNAPLQLIGVRIRGRLSEKYQARERALQSSRETIRHCADSIRAIHRGEFELAHSLLDSARELIAKAKANLQPYPDLLYAGFIDDARKEYAEGLITMAVVTGQELPTPEELDVPDAPYLNGMGEACGELRRFVLDALRRDDLQRCEDVLQAMDDMYSLLITIDFPDSLTGSLRRTTDMVRGVLERTRGDLTLAVRQRKLESRLSAFQDDLRHGSQGGE